MSIVWQLFYSKVKRDYRSTQIPFLYNSHHSENLTEKSLNLVNLVGFADALQGVGGTTSTPYWRSLLIMINNNKYWLKTIPNDSKREISLG